MNETPKPDTSGPGTAAPIVPPGEGSPSSDEQRELFVGYESETGRTPGSPDWSVTGVTQVADPAPIEASTSSTDVAAEQNAAPSVTMAATPSAVATQQAHGAEVEVACPGCGLTLVGEAPRPTAAWFCPRCDYPLFWASEPPPGDPPSTRARRRLPGTAGRVVVGAEPCWHCGEMAEPGAGECFRCAAVLPKPLAPKVYVDVPVPVDVMVPFAARPVIWPYVAASICGASAVTSAVTIWLLGGS